MNGKNITYSVIIFFFHHGTAFSISRIMCLNFHLDVYGPKLKNGIRPKIINSSQRKLLVPFFHSSVRSKRWVSVTCFVRTTLLADNKKEKRYQRMWREKNRIFSFSFLSLHEMSIVSSQMSKWHCFKKQNLSYFTFGSILFILSFLAEILKVNCFAQLSAWINPLCSKQQLFIFILCQFGSIFL